MRPNILIDCSNYFAGGSVNLGDIALYQIAGRRLSELFPRARIRIVTAAPDLIRAQCEPLLPLVLGNAHDRTWFVPGESCKWPLDGAWPLRRLLIMASRLSNRSLIPPSRFRDLLEHPGIDEYFEALQMADLVLLTGGGYFSDEFAKHALGLLDTLAGAQRLGRPTAILSPGFEPVNDTTLEVKARDVLPQVQLIGCRERLVSPQVLRAFGVVGRGTVTGDDAIEIASAGVRNPSANAVGFSLRMADYSRVDGPLARVVGGAVNEAARMCGAPIIPLPINLSAPSDEEAIRIALESTNAEWEGHAPIASPSDLIARTTYCRVTVTGSYHAAVFSLTCGVPVVGLAASDHYRRKLRGLADMFEVGCEVIDLEGGAIVERIRNAVIGYWNQADSLCPILRASALRQVRAQRSFWKQLRDLVSCPSDHSAVS